MCAVKWCLVLALISAGFAQQTSRSSPGNSSSQARNVNSPSAKLVLNGCINTGNNRYTMMQESTGTTFDLRGRDADLKQAQGKLVEVKGYELPPVGGVGLNDVPRLEVKSLRVISAKCPIQTELRRRTVSSIRSLSCSPPISCRVGFALAKARASSPKTPHATKMPPVAL